MAGRLAREAGRLTDMVSRRSVMALAAAGAVAACARGRLSPLDSELMAIETAAGGRLGACILDTASGARLVHRGDERFAMCSTFKLPLAAVILREVDAGRLNADEQIAFGAADIVEHAPVTGPALAQGRMSLLALAEAAQVQSDNVAANLLLRRIGGPAGFTAMLRTMGDGVTRLDRYETDLNIVYPGEINDTTTPVAMAQLVARLMTGDVLATQSRDLLFGWMDKTATGAKRIRAGLPTGWRAGDKTGTALAEGINDKINDVAIVWPPGRAPIVIAAFYEADHRSDDVQDADQAVLANVGRVAANWVESLS